MKMDNNISTDPINRTVLEPAAPDVQVHDKPCLSIDDWLVRDIPPLDFLLGELLCTTTRAFLIAPTGLGKTNFALALASHMASNKDFLNWSSRRPARILIIDGELPREWAKQLIADMKGRIGEHAAALLAENFFYLSTEDSPEMQPLNFPEGQKYIDDLIRGIGGVDFIFFDNLMSLTLGSMKEEEPWAEMLPWVKSLTSQRIGQIWIDHTGHNEGRSYGTNTKLWQFDTVMRMKRVPGARSDIAFSLNFDKARRRTPRNRSDYEEVSIELKDDQWLTSTTPEVSKKKLTPRDGNALKHLNNLLAASDRKECPKRDMPLVTVVKLDAWREALKRGGVTNAENKGSERGQFKSIKESLENKGVIAIWDDLVWTGVTSVTNRDEGVTITQGTRDVT
jgi:hypothetical protein